MPTFRFFLLLLRVAWPEIPVSWDPRHHRCPTFPRLALKARGFSQKGGLVGGGLGGVSCPPTAAGKVPQIHLFSSFVKTSSTCL